MLASMCKLKGGRVSREVTDACLQFWGGQGYMWDNLVTRAYRDTRLVSIGGGADEVMLGIICKMMGILPSKKKFEQAKAEQTARSACVVARTTTKRGPPGAAPFRIGRASGRESMG